VEQGDAAEAERWPTAPPSALGFNTDALLAASLPQVSQPGETFAYCSPGFQLVSAPVGATTGMALADYAAEFLFAPLAIDEFDWPSDDQGEAVHRLVWAGLVNRPPAESYIHQSRSLDMKFDVADIGEEGR
jgi:CubicO group peptidase (beta-lactamase class C family)